LAGDPRREGEFLAALLAAYRHESGAVGAALYADDGAVVGRVAEVGEPGAPSRLARGEGGPYRRSSDDRQHDDSLDRELTFVDLHGGALVARRVLREVGPEHAVLLSTALRVRELHRQVKRQGFEANLRGVELQALYDVGLAITSMLELDELS
jgi:hypothetical protein